MKKIVFKNLWLILCVFSLLRQHIAYSQVPKHVENGTQNPQSGPGPGVSQEDVEKAKRKPSIRDIARPIPDSNNKGPQVFPLNSNPDSPDNSKVGYVWLNGELIYDSERKVNPEISQYHDKNNVYKGILVTEKGKTIFIDLNGNKTEKLPPNDGRSSRLPSK